MSSTKKQEDKYLSLIGEAKQMIDGGFAKLTPLTLRSLGVEAYLRAAADKAARLTNAIALLCEKQMSIEAIPLVRTLAENAMNMRWIMNRDSGRRVTLYFRAYEEMRRTGRWVRSWAGVSLKERMRELGLVQRGFYDIVLKYTYEHAHAGAASLDWTVLRNRRMTEHWMGRLEIYKVVAMMLGHTLQALDARFTGYFAGFGSIFSRILPPDLDGLEDHRLQPQTTTHSQ